MAEEEEKKKNGEEVPEEHQEVQQTPPVDEGSEISRMRKELEEALKSAESYKDQLLRRAAEFENYKRRTAADESFLIRSANEGLILSLLPILDDLRRSLKQGSVSNPEDPFFKGVEMIASKFTRLLEQHGLVPFDSIGKPFDVEYHDALLQIPSETAPAHTVIEEVERGYMLNGRVLRHAKVVVSSGSAKAEEPAAGAGSDESEEVKKP